MSMVRFQFSKTGTSKYISHLDLMSTMQRAFIRAGVKLRYSEGFNPHPYMSVALPLPVGSESICEYIDVRMIDDTIPEPASILLPEGIKIIEAYKPVRKFNEITWVEVSVKIYYNNYLFNDIINIIEQRFNEDSIIISKRTKRGHKEIDIAPFISDVTVRAGECIIITMKISAQNPALNITDLENILPDNLKPDHTELLRIDIYDKNMIKFK